MIDAKNITKFNQTYPKLEEALLFWVCAAGKNGVTSAKCLDKFLKTVKQTLIDWEYRGIPMSKSPFWMIRELDGYMMNRNWIAELMHDSGIGCYNQKSKTFDSLAYTGPDAKLESYHLDLKTCTVERLEQFKGIGPKTARCFLIHSRPNQRLAGLDTHILKFLTDSGIKDVPKTTPTGRRYKELEQSFIELADKAGKPIAEFDLEIWNRYRK
tara:strand:+ start:1480 stop:2115 length:636 start_codon:yes stop_codon:yes gene_type:complete